MTASLVDEQQEEKEELEKIQLFCGVVGCLFFPLLAAFLFSTGFYLWNRPGEGINQLANEGVVSITKTGHKDGLALFKKARKVMDNYKNDDAIRLFEQVKESSYTDPATDHNIGSCHYREKRYAKAEKHWRMALQLNKNYKHSLISLGRYLLIKGREQEAVELATRGNKKHPNEVEFIEILGLAYARQKNYTLATIFLRKASELSPKKASVHINYGTVLFNKCNYGKANAAFEKALLLQPNNDLIKKKLARVKKFL